MGEVTLVGYGNQGKAWAQNLRDSGWRVTISGRPPAEGGKGYVASQEDGFAWIDPEQLRMRSGLIALLLPDDAIPDFYSKYLSVKNSHPARDFLFAHGYSVVFGKIVFAPADALILMAPKGIGKKLRENFLAGSGVMAVLGVEKDPRGDAWQKARAIATGLGCARVKLLESSFREETFADLLSEQAVLCGAVPRLVEKSVEFLVNKGIDPELATFECLNELKLIVDMMVERGVRGMYQGVSRTAKFGGLRAAEQILPAGDLARNLEALWQDIESERFSTALLEAKQEKFASLEKSILEFGNITDAYLSTEIKKEEEDACKIHKCEEAKKISSAATKKLSLGRAIDEYPY